MSRAKLFAHFDQMCWPMPSGELADIGWKCRYGHATKTDVLMAASVIDAYIALIWKPVKKRQSIVSNIRKQAKRPAAAKEGQS